MAGKRFLTTRQQVTSRRSRYTAPALEKGLDILELLASVSEALTHSEIASRLGRTLTEVFRMLVCLEERGYISRTGPDERYQLTLKLFEIVHHHHPLQRLIAQARPLVQQVASETGQSCHLAMLNHGEIVVVAQSDAPGIMGFSVRLGANIDVLNTASGHVILAFQGDKVRACALGAWRHRSRKSIPAGLYRHLNQIRRRGYEELASYQVHGVVNISYPILNQHGEGIAAMTVPFLARIGESVGPPEVKEVLSLASRTLSSAIGGKRPTLPSGVVQP
ncbi:MAG TPA: IclR family transcriptional regulator [Candidatus Acidoferrum sp.]|nr:IclR family transcriptional regulator [Candidatus Acidoferrum sp.]